MRISYVSAVLFTGLGSVHSAAQTAPQKTIPMIAESAKRSVVTVLTANNDTPIAQGTGFIVSLDGDIATNYHVIQTGNVAFVKFPDGTIFSVDGVLAADKTRDLAIIRIHGKKFRALSLGNSDRVRVGEEVIAIGNPLSLESTVSNGIVSGIREVQDEGGKFLQITAPISPGSSGGPLFNMEGEVVGITTMHLKGGENLNFAIPINDAKRLLLTNSSRLRNLPDEPESVKSANTEPPTPAPLPSIPKYWTHLGDGSTVQVRIDGDHLYEMSDQSDQLRFKYICDLKSQDNSWAGKCITHFIIGDGITTSIHSCTLETDEFITLVSPTRIEGTSQDIEFEKARPAPDIYSSGFQPCPRIGTRKTQFALIPRD